MTLVSFSMKISLEILGTEEIQVSLPTVSKQQDGLWGSDDGIETLYRILTYLPAIVLPE